jgi:lipopolysaccharide/colanic/teichoic acid biosynthesis glycosyltransferase
VVASAVVGTSDDPGDDPGDDPDAQSPTPPTGETIDLDRLDGLAEKVGLLDVDAVVVVPSDALGWPEVRRIGWALERVGARLLVRTPVDGASAHRLTAGHLAGCGVIGVAPSRAPLHVRATKAAIDRVAGAALLLALSPLLAMLVVAIRLDSRGPGLFTQTRIGLDGKPFKLYKLRTMCNEAEARKGELGELDEGNGVLFKIRRDPRTTRVGQLLRRTSLDELPQLINVVKGEMSLVGPRPALPQEVQRYDETARRRLAERPGITGLWQVSGRSGLDWDGSVALDVRYTDNVRIVEDLRICWRTVGAVISGRGAC